MSSLVDPRNNTEKLKPRAASRFTVQNGSITMALVAEVYAIGFRETRRETNPRVKFVIARNYPFGHAVRYTEL